MRFPAIAYPETRASVDVWYAAATVKLAPGTREKMGIEFEAGLDELDNFEYAYLEADGIPVSFMRYQSEPEDIYTLQVDAPKAADQGMRPINAFVASIFIFYGLNPAEIQWMNVELDKIFADDISSLDATPNAGFASDSVLMPLNKAKLENS